MILLINGLPVVQIELKALDISPRRAMQQIVDYKNDPGNGYSNTLLCFMQLFIVSNQSTTFYFSNNNNRHFSFNADEQFLPIYQLADKNNRKITRLDEFADHFLVKCTLGRMISRYMVLVAVEQKLLVMRPYQIYAVEAIIDCIHENRGNGYIWHTTGSGKTLTSFKASTLLKDNPDIDKCLFVVDRKDLDRQTRQEFNKFQEGCVEENTNTETLVRRLLSDDYADKVIVTTIQKLGMALTEEKRKDDQQPNESSRKKKRSKNYKQLLDPLRDKRFVFIFDECHRSQFGETNRAIQSFFPKSQLFGFTGTLIFYENRVSAIKIEGEEASYKITADVFEKELHAYTITHAIEDKNVLKFHINYFEGENKSGTPLSESALRQKVVEAILTKHDAATHDRRFNALFATGSINEAIDYCQLFKETQSRLGMADENYKSLNIACVFSPPAEGNRDNKQIQEDLPQEKEDYKHEPEKKKQALKEIIADYNQRFKTNHTIDNFDLYYQDIQQRIKDHQYPNADFSPAKKIDVTIVVDMLLTGFDSKYLNTLYVDKNLKHHGLIQAFSRTNRVLNDTKPYGNILDFRGQQERVDEAIALFSGERLDRNAAKKIWLVDPAPKVIEQYKAAVSALQTFMQSHDLDCTPSEVNNLRGDTAKAGFIKCFKEVQRLKTQLDQYTDLKEDQKAAIGGLLSEDRLRGFRGVYIDIAKSLKKQREKKNVETPTAIEELDFEFVLFASAIIDYDYIMALIAQYTQNARPRKQKMTREMLVDLLCSSANLLDEREDIKQFIYELEEGKEMSEDEIKSGYQAFKQEKLDNELAAIAKKHELATDSLQAFVTEIMNRMIFDGEKLSDLMAPLHLGWRARADKELALMNDLVPYLKRLAEGREISGLSAYE